LVKFLPPYEVEPWPVMWLMTASAYTLTPAAWQACTMFSNAARSPMRLVSA